MKRMRLTALPVLMTVVVTASLSCCTQRTDGPSGQQFEPVDYVSTLVGTLSKIDLSTGNNYPALARPWGMNYWTPQTGRMGDGWTYTYTADKIRGFKQTHQPSPWMNDWGQFSIMPVTVCTQDASGASVPVFDENGRASWFSHKAETAKPYYYSVYLADHDVLTEMTATERAAMFRLTYPDAEMSYFILDAFDRGSGVWIEGNTIKGYTTRNVGGVPEDFREWFVLTSDRPFEYVATVKDGKLTEGQKNAEGDHVMAVVGFPTRRGDVVNLRVAGSFISPEQAGFNLESEIGERSFDTVKEEGRNRWNEVLGRIAAEGGSIDELRTFYSCLYRSVIFPHNVSEVTPEGKTVHYDFHNGGVKDGYYFTDTGFWDTFRALFPFLNLVYPEMNDKMQEGLVNCWLESGFLPEWASPGHRGCMIGNNSASVVTDAYIKGRTGYDIDALWDAVVHGTAGVHPKITNTGRYGWEYYNSLGYVPYDVGINENAARTLEYAYDDWCIWTLGRALGRPEEEIAVYRQRAENYRNVYDPEAGWMCGRNEDGTFQRPFNPFKWGDAFTEGNSLHYTWSVFHDPAGLAALMGGEEAMAAKLDSIFIFPPHFDESYYGGVIHEIREMQIMNMGNYAHGNQPIQHMLYLYDWVRQPWKTQARVREVMKKFYNAAPDGYCGDEDNGQTSAWYVFSAMGFYPVCPGTDQYAIGSPLFDRVTVHLPSGKDLVISASGNSDASPYVKSLIVNGQPWTRNYFTHEQLTSGADIRFTMGSEPNLGRGITDEDAPYSMSNE